MRCVYIAGGRGKISLVKKGKIILIVIMVFCLSLSVVTASLSAALLKENGDVNQATYELVQGLFRFVLECLLFLFVFKGHRWARIVTIVLLGIGGISSLYAALSVDYLMLIITIPYITFSAMLLSRPVKVFQEFKKHGAIDGSSQY